MARIVRRLLTNKLIWLVVLTSLGAALRLTAVEQTNVDRPLRADAVEYYLTAYNLRHSGIYSRSPGVLVNPPAKVASDAYRPPGMPLLIAAVMNQRSDPAQVVQRMQLINIFFGMATVALVFVAAAATLSLSAAIVVGLLVACSPHLVSFAVYVLSETPATFMIAAVLGISAMAVPHRAGTRTVFFLALGAVVGCLSLFRPAFLAFVPFLALAYLDRRDKWHCLLFACLGAAVVVAPWFIRNALNVPHTDEPSLLAATMLEGSYPGFVYQGNKATFPYGGRTDPIFNAAEKSVALTLKEVTRKIAENPLAMTAWYLFEKPVYLFQWDNIDGVGDVFIYPIRSTPFRTNELFQTIHGAFYYGHLAVLVLALIGAIAAWLPLARKQLSPDKRPTLRIASLMLAFLYLVHIPFFVASRYAVPIFPAIYLLAVFAIVILVSTIQVVRSQHQSRQNEPSAAVLGGPKVP
jgi:4-amino-4-deoxy-L-arabinose transferase-like glycosyltransferase